MEALHQLNATPLLTNCSAKGYVSNCSELTSVFVNESEVNTGEVEQFTPLELLNRVIMTVTLIIILYAMGCTLTWQEIWENLKRPYGVFIGMTCQFVMLPLTAFGLAHLLKLPSPQAIGMLVMACTPGGALSNMFTYWSDGDVALSICMTTMSTIVATGMMPFNLFLYGRSWTDKKAVIPYRDIILSLVILLIPVTMGIIIRHFKAKAAEISTKIGSIVGLVFVFVSIGLQTAIFPEMFLAPAVVYVGAFILAPLGMSFGFFFSALCRLPWPKCRTVSVETGIQNVPFCFGIIMLTFPKDFAYQALLFPCIYAMAALIFPSIFVIGWKCRKRKKGEDSWNSVPLNDIDVHDKK